MTQLLLIEDDAEMAREIVCEFHESGYVVEHADDGARGLALALAREYDAIVVDRMLPSLDGMSVLAQLRDCGRTTPVLILSAIGTVAERISGLRSGSDDYLVKPFVLGELVARVEALVRRPDRSTNTLAVGDLRLDLLSRTAERAGRPLELLPREFQLLTYLMRRPGAVVTRSMLLEDIWDCRFELRTNVVDVHVGKLRRKVDGPGERPLIASVRGAGFILDASP